MAPKKGEIVVGLDIGTTKICCIVGEVGPDGIDVIGIGTHPSRGLRKGVVINIESTVESIKKAVSEAELMELEREPVANCSVTRWERGELVAFNDTSMACNSLSMSRST